MKKRSIIHILQGLVIVLAPLCLALHCGAPTRYSMDSDEFTSANSGIVIGRISKESLHGATAENDIARSFYISNKETGERIYYAFAHYFAMRLPEGTYQFVLIATAHLALAPRNEPYEFNIKKGEMKYIGSIVLRRDLASHLKRLRVQKPVLGIHYFSPKYYGQVEYVRFKETGRVIEPFIKFHIVDEHEDVIANFKEKNPNIPTENIIIDLMK